MFRVVMLVCGNIWKRLIRSDPDVIYVPIYMPRVCDALDMTKLQQAQGYLHAVCCVGPTYCQIMIIAMEVVRADLV